MMTALQEQARALHRIDMQMREMNNWFLARVPNSDGIEQRIYSTRRCIQRVKTRVLDATTPEFERDLIDNAVHLPLGLTPPPLLITKRMRKQRPALNDTRRVLDYLHQWREELSEHLRCVKSLDGLIEAVRNRQHQWHRLHDQSTGDTRMS